jgi:hypothetical protein
LVTRSTLRPNRSARASSNRSTANPRRRSGARRSAGRCRCWGSLRPERSTRTQRARRHRIGGRCRRGVLEHRGQFGPRRREPPGTPAGTVGWVVLASAVWSVRGVAALCRRGWQGCAWS